MEKKKEQQQSVFLLSEAIHVVLHTAPHLFLFSFFFLNFYLKAEGFLLCVCVCVFCIILFSEDLLEFIFLLNPANSI